MYKLVIFDLDETLAPTGYGISPENLEILKKISSKTQVAVASGKPVYYLCGFMRQVGIRDCIFIGENGSTFQFGVDLPPQVHGFHPLAENAREALAILKSEITAAVPGIWYQPNEVAVTPFPKKQEEFDIIDACLEKNRELTEFVTIYKHFDSYDILPKGINKSTGAENLGRRINILPEETIAVGDGVNDYPMFEYAGLSVGVNVENPEKVDNSFDNISDALNYVLEAVSVM